MKLYSQQFEKMNHLEVGTIQLLTFWSEICCHVGLTDLWDIWNYMSLIGTSLRPFLVLLVVIYDYVNEPHILLLLLYSSLVIKLARVTRILVPLRAFVTQAYLKQLFLKAFPHNLKLEPAGVLFTFNRYSHACINWNKSIKNSNIMVAKVFQRILLLLKASEC